MAIQGDPDLKTLQSFMFHYGDQPILMQFTGLLDKNGKEIYEGDIVKYKTDYYGEERERIEEVIWYEDERTDLFGEPTFTGFLTRWGECEIIGNIFETPELLNKN